MSREELDLIVERIGTRGDGISTLDTGEQLYIPFSAPGDRLRISVGDRRGNGRVGIIREVVEAADCRTRPVCRHFGDCGGCSFQHLQEQSIADFKRSILITALERRGLESNKVEATMTVPPGRRRRAEFALSGGKNAAIGLHTARGKKIIDLQECPVAVPKISDLLPKLRALDYGVGLGQIASNIRITQIDSGIDILLISKEGREPTLACRQKLAAFAESQNLARIAWADQNGSEPLAVRRRPELRLGAAVLHLPERYFLQPSIEGEKVIVELASRAIAGADSLADLYAGLGSFSFPLANKTKVTAFELDAAMVNAAKQAASGLSLTVERRDLARSPLTECELDHFDAIIFDPPRAGARDQADYLARSSVPTIVAVSCNPNTLARDLRILSNGGYQIEQIVPIDQFTWSAKLEAIAVLRR